MLDLSTNAEILKVNQNLIDFDGNRKQILSI